MRQTVLLSASPFDSARLKALVEEQKRAVILKAQGKDPSTVTPAPPIYELHTGATPVFISTPAPPVVSRPTPDPVVLKPPVVVTRTQTDTIAPKPPPVVVPPPSRPTPPILVEDRRQTVTGGPVETATCPGIIRRTSNEHTDPGYSPKGGINGILFKGGQTLPAHYRTQARFQDPTPALEAVQHVGGGGSVDCDYGRRLIRVQRAHGIVYEDLSLEQWAEIATYDPYPCDTQAVNLVAAARRAVASMRAGGIPDRASWEACRKAKGHSVAASREMYATLCAEYRSGARPDKLLASGAYRSDEDLPDNYVGPTPTYQDRPVEADPVIVVDKRGTSKDDLEGDFVDTRAPDERPPAPNERGSVVVTGDVLEEVQCLLPPCPGSTAGPEAESGVRQTVTGGSEGTGAPTSTPSLTLSPVALLALAGGALFLLGKSS